MNSLIDRLAVRFSKKQTSAETMNTLRDNLTAKFSQKDAREVRMTRAKRLLAVGALVVPLVLVAIVRMQTKAVSA
jgi:hypothetical protein